MPLSVSSSRSPLCPRPLTMLRTTAARAARAASRSAIARSIPAPRSPALPRLPRLTRSFSATPHHFASSSTEQQQGGPRLAGQGEKGLTVALGNGAETTLYVCRVCASGLSSRLLPWLLTLVEWDSSYIWLRDHCREERSFHPQTKQRLVDTFKVRSSFASSPFFAWLTLNCGRSLPTIVRQPHGQPMRVSTSPVRQRTLFPPFP